MNKPTKESTNRSSILVGISIALLTFCIWAYMNRPEQEPRWPKKVWGFSFSPMREGQDNTNIFPTPKEIEADLKLLSGKANAVRTYSMDEYLKDIPELADKYGLNVTLGAWIDTRKENNEKEVERLIEGTTQNNNIVRLIVGNEALLRGNVTLEEMEEYLDRVRSETNIPVSTAEPWHVWVKNPELAEQVDFIAVHMLPYWEGIDIDMAVDYIVTRMNELKALFPDKPIVITEVGWPSNGRTRHNAVASVANEATILIRIIARAEKEKYIYYVMEAFDQPWKTELEGAVGAYWGVYNVSREQKFPFTEPIVAIPNWYILAGISMLIAIIALGIVLVDSHTLKTRGRGFLAIISFAAATVAVWVAYDYTLQYLTFSSVIVGILMFSGMLGVIIVIFTESHEWAEALWVRERRRPFVPAKLLDEDLPMVSIHVPTFNEPPEMVIETLNALAELDYPRFEVIVMDNNTKDEEVWRPVLFHSEKLGPRFRFFHEDKLSGFKSGALNYALRKTSKDASVIGVIDSDYNVDKNWLKDLVPQFMKEKIAIVQAPQDYRDDNESVFKAMCCSEYRGFFYIGMITRNERNAIIQHGTMTLVRKQVLEDVGGWAEWCITEDAELGLRIFEKGYEAMYIPRSYGKGLIPDTFIDFKKQRFRWAYGAIQILRHHAGKIFGREKSALTRGQKYHFFAGWLPWIADSANLIFNFAAIMWSLAMLLAPRKIDAPMAEFALLPLVLFMFKIVKLIYIYRTRIGESVLNTISAAIAGTALSHTIAVAVLQGFATKEKPFFRTPKKAASFAVLHALSTSREELFFMIALLLSAFALMAKVGIQTFDMHVWIIVLTIQSFPYAAAVVMSFISGLPIKIDAEKRASNI